jgi:hypothetical protein
MWQRQAVRHSRAFLQHVVPAVVKPARTLWNEVIGFLFISLAVIFGSATVKSYLNAWGGPGFLANYFKPLPTADGEKAIFAVILGGFGSLLLLYYGISSFVKARRISRS